MLFNSIEFGLFLPIVFLMYWFVFNRNLKLQNLFILAASYVFYGWWDWRFLILIVISSSVDFVVGLQMAKDPPGKARLRLLYVSILVNLGLLGFFKYYNFFVDSFTQAFTFFGYSFESSTLNIILPIGISFYTLQTLSYTIDVYRKKIDATHDPIAFFAYVSFFPQLVAGPIERAKSLLPQMQNPRQFDEQKAKDGLRQMLWGLFKKIVIADNCAVYAYGVLYSYQDLGGSTVLLATCIGTIQFYCDFSGYSDIAIGTARLFGFNLMKNFAFPFFARDIGEFWQRWHISLITWIRDYVVKPLGGLTRKKAMRNIFIIFILTGLWHGASWAFILWGFVQFLFFIPFLLKKRRRKRGKIVAKGKLLPNPLEIFQMVSTFLMFAISGLLFFSESVGTAFDIVFSKLLSWSMFSLPILPSYTIIFSSLIMFGIEWLQREKEHGLEDIEKKLPKVARWSLYYLIIIGVIYFGGNQQEFIYFQF